jgi:hypothetical protein
LATYQTPNITEGFQVFQEDSAKDCEILACLRSRRRVWARPG